MKNLFFSLVFLFSVNAFAIPDKYESEIKQFIYNNLKDINYKQKILDNMKSYHNYFLKKGDNYAANKLGVTIYYIEVFDIESLSDEQMQVILFFIKNV